MYLKLENRKANGGDMMEIFHGDNPRNQTPTILSICSGDEYKICLNDTVVSIGRFDIHPPAGTPGRVVMIREPFVGTNSDICLGVLFGDKFHWMQHKELVFDKGYVVGRSGVKPNP